MTKMVSGSINFRFLLAFLLGLSIGVTFTLVTKYGIRSSRFSLGQIITEQFRSEERAIQRMHRESGYVKTNSTGSPPADDAGNNVTADLDWLESLRSNRTEAVAHAGEDDLAQEMFKKIRILCWIMTQPMNHKTRAMTVLRTWGKRCNILYFVSTSKVGNQTTVIYDGEESRDVLWGKTKLGFKHAYEHHFDDADWFVKADDDTYLIMENMRFMLLDKDPATPVYYGCNFKPIVKQGYMSGGAGYVLSKQALRLFVEESLSDPEKCEQSDTGIEDGNMGFCLQNVGVATGDNRDQEGRVRFFPFTPDGHVNGKVDMTFWYWTYIKYMHAPGVECCSDSSISFHYVSVKEMWTLEYLIYHVHPFGIHPQLTGSAIKDDIVYYLSHRNVTAIVKSVPTDAPTSK